MMERWTEGSAKAYLKTKTIAVVKQSDQNQSRESRHK